MIDFVVPSLGADMDRATLVGWLVEPGDVVKKGQIIAEVETEKGVIEVECWHDGVVEELVVEPGPEKLPVGALLARIRPLEGAPTPEPEAQPPTQALKAPPLRPTAREVAPAPPIRQLAHRLGVDLTRLERTGPGGVITRDDVLRGASAPAGQGSPAGIVPERGRKKASPRARWLASQLDVDLDSTSASGPEDMVVAKDIEAAPATALEPEDKVAAMRRAIARSMSHSKREIPHYYLATHIDLDKSLSWLEAVNAERSISRRILPAALLLKATALALREVPELNGHWIDEEFHRSEAVHIGVAISIREGGLVAPAIHNADQLELGEMMELLRDLVTRARSWRLRSSEMSDPTITVTNLGDRGVETAFPVIIPPQVAMVGLGKVVDAIVPVKGSPVAHPVIHVTLAGDHRVTDGHRGGLLLSTLEGLLQEPESL